jgi:NTE family protein
MARALVLGGGGVTGIAWETGLLLGLEELGVHLRTADRLIGTSAGSAVAANVAGAATLTELYDRQLRGVVQELPGDLGLGGILRLVSIKATTRPKQAEMRRLGLIAAQRTKPDLVGPRHQVIEQRLLEHHWPNRELLITAVDIDSGELEVFSPSSQVSLVDAVAASCAVPMVWPVVEAGGRRYMDGGMWSTTNLPLARGCDRVILLAPTVLGLRGELKELGTAKFTMVAPDKEARATMGRNPLDPAFRAPAAEAGRTQAARVAERVRAVWED